MSEKVKAESKWVRISPLKMKRVIDSVRGKPVLEVLALLRFMPQKGARLLEKVIKSAVANAKNNYKMKEENLYISEVYASKGANTVRYRPRARGRMNPEKKRTSHIRVLISQKGES